MGHLELLPGNLELLGQAHWLLQGQTWRLLLLQGQTWRLQLGQPWHVWGL